MTSWTRPCRRVVRFNRSSVAPFSDDWRTRPIQIPLLSVPFEIDRWWHDGDTVNGLPIEATKRLEISAQQVGRPHTDRGPQNGTVVLWKFA